MRRVLRATGFLLIAFAMPLAFVTCGAKEDEARRAMFPTWRLGEWWEVVSTVAMDRPTWGAPLAGLDLYHRFTVVDEQTVDGARCWVVEAKPFGLRERLEKEYGDAVVARLWVAQAPFRMVRVEKVVGGGRDVVEKPWTSSAASPADGGPLLLTDTLPTILDAPVGPRTADEKLSVPWQAGEFADASGRRVRQTVQEVVEKRGRWRERVLQVSLSDGSVACRQVWTSGRPWPESVRTWSGVTPTAPFVYEARLRAWSKRPYVAWIGMAFLIFGFVAQAMFTMRFVVQWIASERAGRSVIPMAFWHLSLLGGLMLLIYALYRLDPVFILGQASGVFIYVRNLRMRLKERRALLAQSGEHAARP